MTLGIMLAGGGAAYADVSGDGGSSPSGTVNLTSTATADGSAGMTVTNYFYTPSVTPGSTATLHLGYLQPANVCRTTSSCPTGYPNNGSVVTITGLAAAGLTYVTNGDTSAGCVQQDADTVVCHYQYFNNYLKTDNFTFAVSPTAIPGNYTVNVAVHVFDKTLPTDKNQCKDGGFANFHDALYAPVFKNQGDCVSYVATGGRNL